MNKENGIKMKYAALMLSLVCVTACGTAIKLAVPEKFKEQATMQHVHGSGGNKMSFANITTSKIKRGIHIKYPGWGRSFFPENLLWNRVGISKSEVVEKEKAGFRYALTDGKTTVQVYAAEKQIIKTHDFEMPNSPAIFKSFEILEHYEYIFSALISADTTKSVSWELMMTNLYDRATEGDNNPFTFIKRADNGLATNGTDTIIIKPLSIKKTELANGKTRQLPFKLLSGYELSIDGGVIAIIDLIDQNVWFYNELTPEEKLNVSAITTALFARKVHDTKW